MTTTTDQRTPDRGVLWTREHRITTFGLVLVVTLIAFEYMGVATALPTLVANLHGDRLYSWPLTAFAAASAVGTALSGRISDRRGPGGPMLGAVLLFAVGLVVGGTAPTMTVLLVGRVLQGFGAGAVTVAVYVLIAQAYPHRARPAVSALLAGAWVVPSLVGPAIAGVVTQQFGWRWVFLGLVPLVLIGVVLLVPVVRRLPALEADRDRQVRRGLIPAAMGAALGVAALTAVSQHLTVASAPIGLVALVVLVFSLRRLMPSGTVRSRRGMPSVVLSRGLMAGSYFAVESYVPLMLSSVHGASPSMSGLPLTVAAVGWSAASAWQGRKPDLSRTMLLRVAFALVTLGILGTMFVAFGWTPAWLACVTFPVAGAGMGIGMSSISVLQLNLSPAADRGFNSSAVVLADMVSSVLLVGVGGALINALASTARPTAALVPLDLGLSVITLFGALVVARRTDVRE